MKKTEWSGKTRGVKSLIAVMIIALVAGASSALADGEDSLKTYYDQLFAGDQFNITIALPFEQKHTTLAVPVLKDVLDTILSFERDLKDTMLDVSSVEDAITSCFGCDFTKTSESRGLRLYQGQLIYEGRPIRMRLRFIFPEPHVKVSTLKSEFIDALKHDSVVIYLGHSRWGAGFPDFAAPPLLYGQLFRKHLLGKKWEGFNKGYFTHPGYQILMLDACQTDRYYHRLLRTQVKEKPADKLGLIFTTDNTWFDDYPGAAATLISGLINQQAPDEILESMNLSATYYNSLHVLDPKRHGEYLFDGVLAPPTAN